MAWNKEKIFRSSSSEGFKAQTKIDALIYKFSDKEESSLPFTINVWHSKGAGSNTVTVEVERNQENTFFPTLQNIIIRLNVSDRPKID